MSNDTSICLSKTVTFSVEFLAGLAEAIRYPDEAANPDILEAPGNNSAPCSDPNAQTKYNTTKNGMNTINIF